jgi:hypothetical protein
MLVPPNIAEFLFSLPGIGFATAEPTRTARTATEMLAKYILELKFGSRHCSKNDMWSCVEAKRRGERTVIFSEMRRV